MNLCRARPPPPTLADLKPAIEPFSQGQYVIRFDSEAGDPIGRGQEYRYTPQNSNIEITSDGGANSIEIRPQAHAQSESGLPELVNWTWYMFAIGPFGQVTYPKRQLVLSHKF